MLPKKDGSDNVNVIVPDENGDRPVVRVPSKHIIPADAIVINKELGIGEFGVVQQGVWTNEDGERVSRGHVSDIIFRGSNCIDMVRERNFFFLFFCHGV